MNRRRQLSFDDIGIPLSEASLVVVDLETTGTDPQHDAITEIGAVKVRAGEVLEEFQSFVNPERPIPAYIAALTGISDATVQSAPPVRVVLPLFFQWIGDAALVAHNARFDLAFLRAQAAACEIPWPQPLVIDTLALSRATFGRDEVRDHRLATLATYVGAATSPEHRALADARATVDVLHALIERMGPQASTLTDLAQAHRRASPVQIRKRHLAANVPAAPGVYQFLDEQGEVLYVGTSQNLRTRVHTYFTAAETRRRVLNVMPRLAQIRTIECATPLEAAVRETRIIAREQPAANRQGRNPGRALWLRLGPGKEGLRGARTTQAEVSGRAYIGPLSSQHHVQDLTGLLTSAIVGTEHALVISSRRRGSPVQLPDADHHERMRRAMVENPDEVLAYAASRMRVHTANAHYERAQQVQSLAETYLTAARRANRLRSITRVGSLVAARPSDSPTVNGHGWELLAVSHGRFLATAVIPRNADVLHIATRLAATDTNEAPPPAPLGHGYHQEAELILEWLEAPGVRVVQADGPWSTPVNSRFATEDLAAHFAATAPSAD